ncbi:MAG TPA: DsbA family protein [Candidatus Saccharimonadales bacterium]|nr:DsbA family protein [Candidatus Saccharimonadales bacterium]
MSKRSWIIFVIIVVGILVLMVVSSNNSGLNVSNVDTNAIQTGNSQDGNIADHIFGKVGSKVTLIQYGDFQCPPCGNIYPVVKSITNQYKDQLQFVFRNFPIADLHPNAKAAAATAEAAGLQGKYWQMHDKLYDTQSDWSALSITDRTKFFDSLASGLGLSMKKFDADTATSAVTDKINYDIALGTKASVSGTPTFFLDGVKLDPSAYSNESTFKATINTDLKKAGIPLP